MAREQSISVSTRAICSSSKDCLLGNYAGYDAGLLLWLDASKQRGPVTNWYGRYLLSDFLYTRTLMRASGSNLVAETMLRTFLFGFWLAPLLCYTPDPHRMYTGVILATGG